MIIRALFHGKRRINAKVVDSEYGRCWLLAPEEQEKYKRKFIPYSGGKYSMIQKALRLCEKDVNTSQTS